MKEALAEVISQLKEEKKCWATYEKNKVGFMLWQDNCLYANN
jgi:hypothetical protein